MKVLIIGGHGMLGSMLAKVFADVSPTVWDKADIDITDSADVESKIQAERPEIIINAAGYTAVDQAETDKDAPYAVNETGVRNLATVAKQLGATLVHYSTDYVFAGDQADGYAETDQPTKPLSIYGASKLAGEQALQQISPNFYLIRTAWLYGPNGKNFVETMLRLAATKTELSVVSDQHGSPTFTKDVAEFTKELLAKPYPFGIYHAVNSGQTTWAEFAQTIFTHEKLPVTVTPITSAEYPVPAVRPKYSILKNTQGPALRSWTEALDEYLKAR